MERISIPSSETTSSTGRLQKAFEVEQDIKQFAKKSLVGYGGILVSVFLLFITIIAVTTDISISLDSLPELSTEFFLLFFCSYAAYICCSDSGAKSGKLSEIYINTVTRFEEVHQTLVTNKVHCILGDFCKEYIATELKNAKARYLVLAGIDYDDYIREYSSLEDAQINELSGLSTAQKKALMSANAVKPLKLSPEQIVRDGGANIRHSPLLLSPELVLGVKRTIKFATSFLIVIGMGVMIFNDMSDGMSWANFVLVCAKSGAVIFNCFSGFKTGYENIVVYTVNFKKEQISLMQQAIAYAAERKNNESQYICIDEVRAGCGDSAC